MAAAPSPPTSITPASLYSLAIYNPSLGPTDETLPDQIVFWTSRTPTSQNDSLRQIGLAQGIVEFARGFSKCQDLSCVETQKSRIVTTELEQGWWILSYIDFTRIHYDSIEPHTIEYSPREVAPPGVLLAQLRNSYNQFVFSNGTLDHILNEYGRLSLTARLNKFYNKWAWQWDVMLSGNPAVDIWSGIRIGRGVGEDEKEVLRGFVERNQKQPEEKGVLIDMMVSRFGEDEKRDFTYKGRGKAPDDGDGCIYRGVGNLKPESVRDTTEWMSRWSQFGDSNYRFSTRMKKRKRPVPTSTGSGIQLAVNETQTDTTSELAPVEILVGTAEGETAATATTQSTEEPTTNEDEEPSSKLKPPSAAMAALTRNLSEDSLAPPLPPRPSTTSGRDRSNSTSKLKRLSQKPASTKGDELESAPGYGKTHLMYDVLTLGTYSAYSAWGRYHQNTAPSKPSTPEPPLDGDAEYEDVPKGRFLIGYSGDLEEEEDDELDGADEKAGAKKISKKTVWIQRSRPVRNEFEDGDPDDEEEDETYVEESRMVIYINYPFVFTLLFSPSHPLLDKPSFYRALHYQLGPLLEPLLISANSQPRLPSSKTTYDLIFDPDTLTIHTSIPNIPDPHPSQTKSGSAPSPVLPRIEALHIHTQVVKLVEDTRWKGNIDIVAPGERERTNRTTRGWWIGWMKLEGVLNHISPSPLSETQDKDKRNSKPGVDEDQHPPSSAHSSISFPSIAKQPTLLQGRREAFIVRKELDNGRAHKRTPSNADERLQAGSVTGGGVGGKITEGLGVDPRKYFEQVLGFSART